MDASNVSVETVDSRVGNLLDRHHAFWLRAAVDRPLIGQPQRDSVFPLQNMAYALNTGTIRPADIEPELFLPADRDGPLEDEGDLLVAHWAAPALPWTEAIAGCPVYVALESGTTWAEPALQAGAPLSSYRPRVQREWLDKLVSCTKALLAHSDGSYWIATTLMRGPLDMLAAMIGAQRLCQAFVDEPAQVDRLLDICTSIWIETAQTQLACIPCVHGGYTNRYRIWAPGTSVVTQADLSSIISPRTYARFLLPCDHRITAEFDFVTMHSHSAGQTQLDLLLELDALACIEISVDHLGPTFEEQVPLYRRILERKPLVLMNPDAGEVAIAIKELPAAGLAMIPRHESNLK